MERLNRFICWATGKHVYSIRYMFDVFPKCEYCGLDLEERCTGWPKTDSEHSQQATEEE